MSQRRHENRAVALLQLLLGPEAVQSEVAVPRVAHSIDALVRVEEPGELWGPLGSLVAHRTLVIEHESRSPSRLKLHTAIGKVAWVIRREWPLVHKGERRLPLLLFLSAGLPSWVRRGEHGIEPDPIQGVYQPRLGWPSPFAFVHLRGLPGTPGLSILKLMATPRSEAEVADGIDRLERDPAVLQLTKAAILEAIMNERIPATETERWMTVASVKASGRAEGRTEGRAEGRAEGKAEGKAMGKAMGRQALLKVARALFEPEQVAELESITDLGELEQRILALVKPH